MIKKIYRTIFKFFHLFTAKVLGYLLRLMNLNITPSLNKVNFFNFKYNKNSRRIMFDTKKLNSFNRITIDTTFNNSILCELGKKFPTNKSPINLGSSRSGFTGVYNLLFSHFVNKKIMLGEIGIEDNNSIKMWRKFFKKAIIHGFEFDDKKIKKAEKNNLKKTYYHKINVNSEKSIQKSFKKIKSKFDIIIDDSTHIFDDQIRVVKNCYKFLNANGFLIIEDIYKFRSKYSEENYFKNLKKIRKYFHDIIFIDCNHVNNYTASWKNEKILLLIRNNKK